jgi:K+-transporting ATPase ATPase C chain
VVKGVEQTQPDPRYFQTRPSATAPPDNAAATTFSNLGPNDLATKEFIVANEQMYLCLNAKVSYTTCIAKGFSTSDRLYDPDVSSAARIPVDAVDSSASGIDPDISPANADIQAYRIAAVRHLSLTEVHSLISKYTQGNSLGFMGDPGVDVLQINLALDSLTGSKS